MPILGWLSLNGRELAFAQIEQAAFHLSLPINLSNSSQVSNVFGVLRVGHVAGGTEHVFDSHGWSRLAAGQYFGCLDWSFEESSAIS